jgi:predicted nucleic-acid-binding Zn-ribbon protein
MKSGTCPKCQATDVIVATPIDRDDSSSWPLRVAHDNNPSAMIFKDRHTTTLQALVCGGCGYTELYADDPSELKR